MRSNSPQICQVASLGAQFTLPSSILHPMMSREEKKKRIQKKGRHSIRTFEPAFFCCWTEKESFGRVVLSAGRKLVGIGMSGHWEEVFVRGVIVCFSVDSGMDLRRKQRMVTLTKVIEVYKVSIVIYLDRVLYKRASNSFKTFDIFDKIWFYKKLSICSESKIKIWSKSRDKTTIN